MKIILGSRAQSSRVKHNRRILKLIAITVDELR